MTHDASPPRGPAPYRKIRSWLIGRLGNASAEGRPPPPIPERPAGLDLRLPAEAAARLREADPDGGEAMEIFIKILESVSEELDAVDPKHGRPDVLPYPRRVVYAVNGFESDTNNGGLDQYYINSWSDCAHELPGMLREIGLPELADLAERANAVFPDGPPASRPTRLAAVDRLGEAASERWEELTDEFFGGDFVCQPALVRHILAHEGEFFRVE